MMRFLETDEQTQRDLGIYLKNGRSPVFEKYNCTVTAGGGERLAWLFCNPPADVREINTRADIFRFFTQRTQPFPLTAEAADGFSAYLRNNDRRTRLQTGKQSLIERVKSSVAAEREYTAVTEGLSAGGRLVKKLTGFIGLIQPLATDKAITAFIEKLSAIVACEACVALKNADTKGRNNALELAELDEIVRFKDRNKMVELLQLVAELDVYMAVGRVAAKYDLQFAKALSPEGNILKFERLYHPLVPHAVKNDVELGADKNLLFLTGANMAGKSTLMKSMGLALYLAHIGLPVAVFGLQFSVLDGIYTNINLSDNVEAGLSHFYAEVLRLKKISLELRSKKRLFVVFDELFRGTNVKDAYDGTVAVTRAFAEHRSSFFVISTHIMEAGELLSAEPLSIVFRYLPTVLQNGKPVYPRVLKHGITADRQGMVIIENEGVLALLDEGLSIHYRKEEGTCHS